MRLRAASAAEIDTGAEDLPLDLTTVDDTSATVHRTTADGAVVVERFEDLTADTAVDRAVNGRSLRFRTLPKPVGERIATVTTVNDVHFGELAAGQIDDHPIGPIRRPEPGTEPYPEVMNRAAAAEMAALDPDAVVVKGDLSLDGTDEEWAAFEACYRTPFGERLHVVRGNHDAYRYQDEYAGDRVIDVPGVRIVLIDTTIPGRTTGDVTSEQAEWLDTACGDADRPVVVMGHHQQWIADPAAEDGTERRSDDYFGIHPDGSDRLDAVVARHEHVLAYTAGHTHRHRVRRMRRSGRPTVEVGCTKDFPGTWAEYRVHERGVMQVVHRIADPAALRWSESCRGLYSDFGIDYEHYALGTLADRCFLIEW